MSRPPTERARSSRHPVHALSSAPLFRTGGARSRRASSFDASGGNDDFIVVGPGETAELLACEGAGCVTRIYCAMLLPDLADHRNAILRCFWDGNSAPSVEVPLGDFFTLAHGRVRELSSELVAVNAGCGSSHGLNAYFAMPFADGAHITLENRGPAPLGGAAGAFWFHIEYETYEQPLPDDVLRFHASFRRERPTVATGDRPNVQLHDAVNVDGTENYVALDTVGEGRMIGLVLEIDNPQGPVWYGEGDDMVFIDGEPWPPSIHGTGTEEIFGAGACPTTEFASRYSGFHLVESPNFDGLVGMYRWFVPDPIHFAQSLRWTVEHGHANNFAADFASVAYWYQAPAAKLPGLGTPAELAPPLGAEYAAAYEAVERAARSAIAAEASTGSGARLIEVCRVAAPLYAGRFTEARQAIEGLAS